MKKYFTIIIASILCMSIIGCTQSNDQKGRTYQKEIDQIYVYHSELGHRVPEYKIDLKNKKFWKFAREEGNFVERNPSLENEGFTFVRDLSDEKIETFILESARYGLTNWDDSYVNNHIKDGHNWGMTINFADSTEKKIYGSNKYPETWDDMYIALEHLTGENILSVKSN